MSAPEDDLMQRLGMAVARLERAARKQEQQAFALHGILLLSGIGPIIAIGGIVAVYLATSR